MKQNISKLQWVILIVFGLIFMKEFYDYVNVLIALINRGEVLTLMGLWLIPLATDLLGICGIYLITKFKKLGFWLFYVAYFTSMYFDFERGIGTQGKIITLVGNLVIFLIFFLPTRKISRLSK